MAGISLNWHGNELKIDVVAYSINLAISRILQIEEVAPIEQNWLTRVGQACYLEKQRML